VPAQDEPLAAIAASAAGRACFPTPIYGGSGPGTSRPRHGLPQAGRGVRRLALSNEVFTNRGFWWRWRRLTPGRVRRHVSLFTTPVPSLGDGGQFAAIAALGRVAPSTAPNTR